MFTVVSPAGAADPVYVDLSKVHTIIGPVLMRQPLAPKQTDTWHEVRIMMDAPGVQHTVRFSDPKEASLMAARLVAYSPVDFVAPPDKGTPMR